MWYFFLGRLVPDSLSFCFLRDKCWGGFVLLRDRHMSHTYPKLSLSSQSRIIVDNLPQYLEANMSNISPSLCIRGIDCFVALFMPLELVELFPGWEKLPALLALAFFFSFLDWYITWKNKEKIFKFTPHSSWPQSLLLASSMIMDNDF